MWKSLNINDLKTKISSRRHLISILLVILALSFFLFSDYGIIKRISLEFEKSNLTNKIDMEYRQQDSLKKVVKKLASDTTEIERIAREYYGMLKPGEKVYIVRDRK